MIIEWKIEPPILWNELLMSYSIGYIRINSLKLMLGLVLKIYTFENVENLIKQNKSQ